MRRYVFIEDNGDIKADANCLIQGDLTVSGAVGIELQDLSDVTITNVQLNEVLSKSATNWINAPVNQAVIDGGSFI